MKLSDNQTRILRYLESLPGGKTTAYVFNETCRDTRVVRSLFSNGLVAGDEIPARYVSITDVGRAAIGSVSPHEGAKS